MAHVLLQVLEHGLDLARVYSGTVRAWRKPVVWFSIFLVAIVYDFIGNGRRVGNTATN